MFKWFGMFLGVITVCFIVLVVLMKTSKTDGGEEIKYPGQEMYEQLIEEADSLK